MQFCGSNGKRGLLLSGMLDSTPETCCEMSSGRCRDKGGDRGIDEQKGDFLKSPSAKLKINGRVS